MPCHSVNPRLSPHQKAAVRHRYAAGESLAALRSEYRVWTATVRRCIGRANLRAEDTEPKRCRVCAEPVTSSTQRGLCAAHVRSFCCRCEDRLPAGRVNRWCAPCEHERKQALWAKPGRHCTTCGAPVTVHACECERCLSETYLLDRRILARVARDCVECGQQMPPGRRSPRCSACYRWRERERRRELMKLGQHRCIQCGECLSLRQASYCAGCHTMQENWRHAWHANNPVARLLRTVEKRRRWQATDG